MVHSMREEGPSTCEVCGAALRRVIHPTGIIFKGSGFYSTDSRRPTRHGAGTKTAAAGEKGGGAASDSSGSAAEAPPSTGGSASPTDSA
jgi:predicted nucleic acid-binding Zn ribbon protein